MWAAASFEACSMVPSARLLSAFEHYTAMLQDAGVQTCPRLLHQSLRASWTTGDPLGQPVLAFFEIVAHPSMCAG